MPQSAQKIASFFGLKLRENLDWKIIGKPEGIGGIQITSEVLFSKLEDENIEALKEKYSGTQKERLETKVSFSSVMDLRVAKVEKVERHPKADKLYILSLEIGEGVTGNREERTIVTGLVPFYTEEQLLGKRIIVAYNLKPAKLRGIESRGMLLAAGDKKGISKDGEILERVEVLDAGLSPTGTRLLPEGENAVVCPAEIDIDTFFTQKIYVRDFKVYSGEKKLCLEEKPVITAVIPEGEVH
jgi:methionyl-tRNA synthetase